MEKVSKKFLRNYCNKKNIKFLFVSSFICIFVFVFACTQVETSQKDSSAVEKPSAVESLMITEVKRFNGSIDGGISIEVYNAGATAVFMHDITFLSSYYDKTNEKFMLSALEKNLSENFTVSESPSGDGVYRLGVSIPSENFFVFHLIPLSFSIRPANDEEYDIIFSNEIPSFDEAGFIEIRIGEDEASKKTVDFIAFGSAAREITPRDEDFKNYPDPKTIEVITGTDSLFRTIDKEINFFTEDTWQVTDSPTLLVPPDAGCILASRDDLDRDGIFDCLEDAAASNDDTYFGISLYDDWGARTDTVDIFLEIDYVPCSFSKNAFTQPALKSIELVENMYNQLFYKGRPIKIHVDLGSLYGDALSSGNNLGGGNAVTNEQGISYFYGVTTKGKQRKFREVKNNNFKRARKQFFHYALFSYSLSEDGYFGSGADAELPGNDMVIASANISSQANYPCTLHADSDVTVNQTNKNYVINKQALAVAHELGHNLDLYHSGSRGGTNNNKINYLSIMNYLYSSSGLPRNGGVGNNDVAGKYYSAQSSVDFCVNYKRRYLGSSDDLILGFSDGSRESVNEAMPIKEKDSTRTWAESIDFNCDGYTTCTIDSSSGSEKVTCPYGYLSQYDDFANIKPSCMLTNNLAGSRSCELPNFFARESNEGSSFGYYVKSVFSVKLDGVNVCSSGSESGKSFVLIFYSVDCVGPVSMIEDSKKICDLSQSNAGGVDYLFCVISDENVEGIKTKIPRNSHASYPKFKQVSCTGDSMSYDDCSILESDGMTKACRLKKRDEASMEFDCELTGYEINSRLGDYREPTLDDLKDSDDKSNLKIFFDSTPVSTPAEGTSFGAILSSKTGSTKSSSKATIQKVFDDIQPAIYD